MKKLINGLLERCTNGLDTMLVTIVDAGGSAPRGTGASMIVGQEGRLMGTIGGGMLEYKAIETARDSLENGRGQLKEYGLTKDAVADLGMVCGGHVHVLFTYLSPSEKNKAALTSASDYLTQHSIIWLLLPFNGMEVGFFSEDEGLVGITTGIIDTAQGKCYVQKLVDESRVFVFGGGHLSQELVPLLTHLSFRCIVADDRADFSTAELFPDAEEVYTLNYKNLGGALQIQSQDYIVVVTRGHVGDYEVLRFALTTPAYYIGAVGSRSKIATVNGNLKADGFTEQEIARITTPIGIDIKSETPAEIAVSIAAQLIQRRAES